VPKASEGSRAASSRSIHSPVVPSTAWTNAPSSSSSHACRGFGELSRAALASGALDRKVKELITMVIGVVHGCDGCIASHAQGAVRAGASIEEASEAIGVAILMYGGPADVHGARAYDAFCEFAAADVTV
jgi:AhpD family alkylhydroperoxidase